MKVCERCGRPFERHPERRLYQHGFLPVEAVSVTVHHSYYGCDTGCCGHIVVFGTADGQWHDLEKTFEFSHPTLTEGIRGYPKDDEEKWARDLIEEQVPWFRDVPLDLDEMELLDD